MSLPKDGLPVDLNIALIGFETGSPKHKLRLHPHLNIALIGFETKGHC